MRKRNGALDAITRIFVVPHVDTSEGGRKTTTGLKELGFVTISVWKRNLLTLTRCKVTAPQSRSSLRSSPGRQA